MTFYATTNDCLRRFILAYFGETTSPLCDNCSNCHSTFEQIDATVDAQNIISCVFRLQERGRSLGKGTIVNILRGSKAQRITQLGLETLSTYGIMAAVAPDRIYRIIDHLLATGHLALTGTDYPLLQLANDWRTLLAKDARYLIKVPKEVQPADRSERTGKKRTAEKAGRLGVTTLTSPEQFDLFERLRKLRFEIARREGLPAYIVFSDATLRDMAVKRPHTNEEFLEVSGVGTMKLERYGKAFLDCISIAC
jgi:ATP-dependent DNA helicase RecQ